MLARIHRSLPPNGRGGAPWRGKPRRARRIIPIMDQPARLGDPAPRAALDLAQ
ncbi:hypothetical protein L531_2243 [Bordetella bronchiseptica MO275]|nr:hypothetical protein L531_2243 [Bordetella bronchiseptica MO275]